MSLGEDAFDQLAYALSESDFDAVERNGLRAEWTDDAERVRVSDPEAGETVLYDAEDLVRAASDRELRNAREQE